MFASEDLKNIRNEYAVEALILSFFGEWIPSGGRFACMT